MLFRGYFLPRVFSTIKKNMRNLIVGIGGTTNSGKTTLANSLHENIANSCIIGQDAFFKDDSLVAVDSNGFKQYDVIEALHMDTMISEIQRWSKDPLTYLSSCGQRSYSSEVLEKADNVCVLIVEGFLIYNYRPLSEIIDMKYFLHIPYETCKARRCSRMYTPPDPCGYFDGHVWPMYLKNQKEMEDTVSGLVYLDGMQPREKLFAIVYEEVCLEMERLSGKG